MSRKFKKLAQELSQKTGTSYAGAVNLLRKGNRRPPQAPLTILQYCDELGIALYPVQRFILKMLYHLKLDSKIPRHPHKRIVVRDPLDPSKKPKILSEVGYLKFLYDAGRCNIGVQDHARRQIVGVLGRRSGKTTLSALFTSYETYRLLQLGNPQAHYGLPEGNRIQVLAVSHDKDQAGFLFNEVTSHITRLDSFKDSVASNTQTSLKFRTSHDLEQKEVRPSIQANFKSCLASSLRGYSNAAIVLDEVAFFHTGEDTYMASAPSTAWYSQKGAGRMLLISTPDGKEGTLFRLHRLALNGPIEQTDDLLMLQIPTWEANPKLPDSIYMAAKEQGTFAEWSAKFVAKKPPPPIVTPIVQDTVQSDIKLQFMAEMLQQLSAEQLSQLIQLANQRLNQVV